ncbi:hypothetical protein M427DRAFT_367338 [Gonapodya prolifera JEL478]|uniref:Uncharacterized protein n=1 Tax=Gonapodya prolifera (strain JEL478) TaxID=1344416 RepID=A0A139A9U5_GONPJ|nr:hypothetical protein M427DRAFT_367338 [Gonapodya prolifera JEL478]|eukprot:KXS13458.1 hypothetical protein M427DRAFT_367338 [Gonapodya prolifera JEL478]
MCGGLFQASTISHHPNMSAIQDQKTLFQEELLRRNSARQITHDLKDEQQRRSQVCWCTHLTRSPPRTTTETPEKTRKLRESTERAVQLTFGDMPMACHVAEGCPVTQTNLTQSGQIFEFGASILFREHSELTFHVYHLIGTQGKGVCQRFNLD